MANNLSIYFNLWSDNFSTNNNGRDSPGAQIVHKNVQLTIGLLSAVLVEIRETEKGRETEVEKEANEIKTSLHFDNSSNMTIYR